MLRKKLREEIKKALKDLNIEGEPFVESSQNLAYGDYSTNVALVKSKELGKSAQKVSEELISKLESQNIEGIDKIGSAGPGFINFWISKDYLQKSAAEIIKQGEAYGRSGDHKGELASVEFVSANPTGPLHLGNARGGPIGDVLSNVLENVGYKVTREYLHNDVGGQVKQLGATICSKLEPNKTREEKLWYKGGYIENLSSKVDKLDRKFSTPRKELSYEEAIERLGKLAVEIMFEEIITDIKQMGIEFDLVTKESDLREKIPKILEEIKKVIKKKDGALWFAPNDQFLKDRETVIQKSDKEYTYFASDIVYHKEKFERGKDLVIDVLGANHAGHLPRLKAAVKALGYDPDKLKFILYQNVRLKKEDQILKMSKREGEFITAREVLTEVGRDAFRFFLLSIRPQTHLDFDSELAKKRSSDNPVFYIQYANARISSLFEKVKDVSFEKSDMSLLLENEELDLLRRIIKFPELLEDISQNFAVNNLTMYALELATLFHKFYETHKVISEDQELTKTRLLLLKATQITLKNTLSVLGISAPDRM
jgi:arginyl-tRNA synthetase